MAAPTGSTASGPQHSHVPTEGATGGQHSGLAGLLKNSSSSPVPVTGQQFIPRPLAGSDDEQPLADRQIKPLSSASSLMSSPSDPPPGLDNGEIYVEGGGKIIFSRTNGDNLMTAQDELLAKVHEKEQSGELSKGSTGKLKKFFGVLAKVFGAIISSKKFQTGIGIIGIGIFIGISTMAPILLMGTVPFLIIFANGFIETPGQPVARADGDQPPAKNESNDSDNKERTESSSLSFPPPPPPSSTIDVGTDTGSDKEPPEQEARLRDDALLRDQRDITDRKKAEELAY